MNADRQQHITQLAALIKDVEVAMFTTTGVDGRLYSRPLGTQEVEFDGDLWFATSADSPKVAEIALNPRVNVAYASPSKNSYVSVAGTARIVDDRAKIDALWSPAMKLFFPEGKDDPNLRLIHVQAESAEYWDGPGTLLGKALSFVLSAVQDEPSRLGDNGFVDLR
ncbi:pyridoxamine 5'-phosphate oxidase family protein [Stenotrophomonas sp. Sa5BUN4]|uniref:Pyridoxamine 5'-phosphate oxidase family protein n=1 Tax=Stenotrophomonas lacuserhaii TaxID=2760084 RepID=A0A8X8FYE8_9GAMM|nr:MULTISPECIES: pyridoxamine 5'-phosphate oxidase family protein [Stenotrophomonas]MBD7955743.1 pyridoxamine 5'-phosphate oxidase family protein [Stenotrophomonas pennii]MDX3930527.1 pyridoxamine 5'-phosphate oxidase family protein [Stenotrophomonas sp.]PKH71562.1 general stress protein [Stenotrophomonas sp. Betaine-02u-23]PKH73239.1 general stress protein [Stenotrophomonas sp. Betaine-02u-21]PKH95837.1 general stress protein [Stenotrophomonas sp. Bg11-02]